MKIYQSGSELISGGHTYKKYRQTGDLISLFSFLESRPERAQMINGHLKQCNNL
jgi:hypothetical protein